MNRLSTASALLAIVAASACSSQILDERSDAGTGGAGPTSTSQVSSGGAACAASASFIEVNGDGAPRKFTGSCGDNSGPSGWYVHPGAGDERLAIQACEKDSSAWISVVHGKMVAQIDYVTATNAEHLAQDTTMITPTVVGAVGEAIEGHYTGTVDGLTLSGSFRVCRTADHFGP